VASPIEWSIHEDARRSFDARAEQLASRLRHPREEELPSKPTYQPDVHIAAALSEEHVADMGLLDPGGNPIARSFLASNGAEIGLFGDDHREFIRLVESIQRTETLRRHVSRAFLSHVAFEWIRARHAGDAAMPLMNTVLQRCRASVRSMQVWVPIADLHVLADLPFGRVRFSSIARSQFDQTIAFVRERGERETQDVTTELRGIERRRREYQGRAAVVVDVVAESQHARDLAVDLAQEAVDYLRVFHPSHLYLRPACHLDVWGATPVRTAACLIYGHQIWEETLEEQTDVPTRPLVCDREYVAILNDLGLASIGDLLTRNQQAPFVTLLLGALRRYSRSVLALAEDERLLRVIVALETMLLADSSEAIQQNIADRLAYYLETDGPSRRAVVDDVKRAYGVRSRYVHHGQGMDEITQLERFLEIAWRFFLKVIKDADKYQDKVSFIQALDEIKYA